MEILGQIRTDIAQYLISGLNDVHITKTFVLSDKIIRDLGLDFVVPNIFVYEGCLAQIKWFVWRHGYPEKTTTTCSFVILGAILKK